MSGSVDGEAPYGDHGPNWALPALGVGVVLLLPVQWDAAGWADVCALIGAVALAFAGHELARALEDRVGRAGAVRGRSRAAQVVERRFTLAVIPVPSMVCGLIAGFLATALSNSTLLGALATVVFAMITATLFRRSLFAGERVGARLQPRGPARRRRTPR